MLRGRTKDNFLQRLGVLLRSFSLTITILFASVLPSFSQHFKDHNLSDQTSFGKKAPKETALTCPSSLVTATFLTRPICVHQCLEKKLAVARTLLQRQGFTEAAQLGVQRLTSFRPHQTSLHGQGLAIDIDAATNPYIIHERNEGKLDTELVKVYERIAQFLLGRASVIPYLGTDRDKRETRRIYVARIYDALKQESEAMQLYFSLMQQGSRLQKYVRTSTGTHRVRHPSTFFTVLPLNEVAKPESSVMIDQLRLFMLTDWMILTGDEGPPIAALASAGDGHTSQGAYLPYPQMPLLVPDDPDNREIDRPFDSQTQTYPGRSPLNGFLTLRKELVLALIDAGFRWGAIDFGRSSGDLMHFDSHEATCSENTNEKFTPLEEVK